MSAPIENIVAVSKPLNLKELFVKGESESTVLLTSLATHVIAALFFLSGLFQYMNRKIELIGPQPKMFRHGPQGFSFDGISPKSKSIDLSHFDKLTAHEAQNVVLNSLPFSVRPLLSPYLPIVFKYAQVYRVDPFWAISVMWTESHFDINAVSRVNAQGLMQVMPATALHIGKILNKKMTRKSLLEYAKSPYGNIEFGIFYLSFLLEKFKGNHTHATVAYNMGPYWVSKRMRYKLPVGVKNNYLDKVNRAYRNISKTYREESSRSFKETALAFFFKRL